MPHERFEKAAQNWDENPGRILMAKNIASTICKQTPISPEWTAIDYGCGTGLITLAIEQDVKKITGFDSSPAMLSKLMEKVNSLGLSNVETKLVDLETEGVPEMQADLVVSSMTLHHIANIPALLKKLYMLLKPGGYIALADLDIEDGSFHADNSGVQHFGLDREWIKSELAQAGFLDCEDTTAHVAERETNNGMKKFPVFLVWGKKGQQ
jgi:ubiquinone/menaquinone biosynthesis C-methylase UbiE